MSVTSCEQTLLVFGLLTGLLAVSCGPSARVT